MGFGCPHCRVVSGAHDDWCPGHSARAGAEEELEELRNEVAELDAEAEVRQRAIENRIVIALTALGYPSPTAGKTKLMDAMDMIAEALEDMCREFNGHAPND